jgi:hypothetical protein
MLLYSTLLRNAEGAFYLNIVYDPCYVYLISSLNLAQFTSPVHFDHPGTPVQFIGAVVLKLTHFVSGRSADISGDVLSDPETYLGYIQFALVLINCLVLFFTALIIYRSTGNLLVTLLIQLSPFLSYTVSYELSVVSAENFLISVILLLTAFLIKYISDPDSESKNNYVLTFSLICGLGLATKITFFPPILIPVFLLKGITKKIKFAFFTLFSFMIFILPAISNFSYFITWVKSLFLYDELYGKGSPDIINPSAFFVNMKEIFSDEIVFTAIYIIILFTLLSVYFLKQKEDKITSGAGYRLLLSVFISMTLQVIIVSKHYSGHYMVPALMLSAAGLYLSIKTLTGSFPLQFKKININYPYAALILIFTADIITGTYYNYNELDSYRLEAIKTNEFIDRNIGDKILITSYGSSSKAYALAFTTTWAGSNKEKYQNIIGKLYPDNLYFEFWRSDIFSMSGKENLKELIRSHDKILFQNNDEASNGLLLKDLINNYNFNDCTVSKIYSSLYGESVYEISLK